MLFLNTNIAELKKKKNRKSVLKIKSLLLK